MSETLPDAIDTARWLATYRALESERPDALFRDPFARRLAGERGEHLAREISSGSGRAWALIVRTKVFDEIITRLIVQEGVDTVLNLGASLDTRAYRLPLPPRLRWFDVDVPEMIAYKTAALADATPACVYEAIALDVSDAPARQALFDRINAESMRVLVVTEGLLVYWAGEAVALLANDLASRPTFADWLIHLAKPSLLGMMNRSVKGRLAERVARFQFAPEAGSNFFEPYGWSAAEIHSTWDAARRLKRRARAAWLWEIFARLGPPSNRDRYRLMASTVLLERAE